MGRKADRQAARVAAAQEREADESWRSQWVRAWRDIGLAVGRRVGVIPEERKLYDRRALRGAQLLALVALGSSGCRVR